MANVRLIPRFDTFQAEEGRMSSLVGSATAAVVGLILAVLSVVGLVSTQSATPPVVTAPYVTYDS